MDISIEEVTGLSTKAPLKRKIRALTEFYLKLFDLEDYKLVIELSNSDKMSTNYAEIWANDDNKLIKMSLNVDKVLKEPEELEFTIVHELLHIVFKPMCDTINGLVKNFVKNDDSVNYINDGFKNTEHRVIYLFERVVASAYKDKKKVGVRPKGKDTRVKKVV